MSSNIEIRDVSLIEEIRAVEELQKEVWGIPDIEAVPLTQMAASIHSGGTLIGAFDNSEMVGFAYGFAGFERGQAVHHSHMLAVRSEYRSHDIGRRLKLAQRDRVLAQGLNIMTWTFDPLQSLNAYFNFGKLGVVADQYYVDFYGSEAASFLHRNGTDRFWVSWHLDTDRVSKRIASEDDKQETKDGPAMVAVDANGKPGVNELQDIQNAECVTVQIPSDINAIQREDPELSLNWRIATREAFVSALEAGLIVTDFYRSNEHNRAVGVYVLTRDSGSLNWKATEEKGK